MAEAAGLVVGGIALVDLFNTCIELFNYFSLAKSCNYDAKILSTKLDIERTLYLHWATRIRLFDTDCEASLAESSLGNLVREVLTKIHQLLSDGEVLRKRYGLQEIDRQETVKIENPLSKTRFGVFSARLRRRNDHSLESPRGVSSIQKILWAIHDSDKFGSLIQDLSYFRAKLNELVPPTKGGLEERMLDEDLDTIDRPSDLSLIVQATSGRHNIADLAEKKLQKISADKILRALWFRTMNDRRDNVEPAHAETFTWALDSTPCCGFDDLTRFLTSGTGIYWISGKPGSGKSTLMKYIYDHKKTTDLLRQWAGPSPCHLISFFFWYLSPIAEHTSQAGLLRTLLYKLLRRMPALIPELLPKTWKEIHGSDQDATLPSDTETRSAFTKLGAGLELPCKWCLLIDGLDEYDGDYASIIQIVEELAKNQNIKLIVSSRPLTTFASAFRDEPKLKVNMLTKPDIAKFVHDTLDSHDYMRKMCTTHPEIAKSIPCDLVNKASGVFLWVALACRSVLQGFTNADSVLEIQRRIDELPVELERLFEHILSRIDDRYRTQARKLLSLRCHSQQVQGKRPLTALSMAIAAEYDIDIYNPNIARQLSTNQRKAIIDGLADKLNSRCYGMLEVRYHPERYAGCPCGPAVRWHNPWVHSFVEFLHRTVFDFLKMPGKLDLDGLDSQDTTFDCGAILSCVSSYLLELSNETLSFDPMPFFHDSLQYLQSSSAGPDRQLQILLELVRVSLKRVQTDDGVFFRKLASFVQEPTSDTRNQLRAARLLAVEVGLTAVIRGNHSFEENLKPPCSLRGVPLLCHVIRQPISGHKATPRGAVEMIEHLLFAEADPNEAFLGIEGEYSTPWKIWSDTTRSDEGWGFLADAEITQQFVKAGADIRSLSSEARMLEIFRCNYDKTLTQCRDILTEDAVRQRWRDMQVFIHEQFSALGDEATSGAEEGGT